MLEASSSFRDGGTILDPRRFLPAVAFAVADAMKRRPEVSFLAWIKAGLLPVVVVENWTGLLVRYRPFGLVGPWRGAPAAVAARMGKWRKGFGSDCVYSVRWVFVLVGVFLPCFEACWVVGAMRSVSAKEPFCWTLDWAVSQ